MAAGELAVVRNVSGKALRLGGFVVKDAVGSNTSAPLEDFEIPAGATFNIWTQPGADDFSVTESATDIFWRNKSNGQPRKSPLLNNEGDGLQILNASGAVVCKASASAGSTAATSQPQDAPMDTDDTVSVAASTATASQPEGLEKNQKEKGKKEEKRKREKGKREKMKKIERKKGKRGKRTC